jgi:hypothetical protein
VFVFSENSMVDALVAQASEGALRALPYGIFTELVSQETFSKKVGGIPNDGSDISGVSSDSFAYHSLNHNLFAASDIQIENLSPGSIISNEQQHASWLVQAAIDSWLNVVPFTHRSHAHAVVQARSTSKFASNVSNAAHHHGRVCNLAAFALDLSQYLIKIKDQPRFVHAAWEFVDLAAICLFSVRTFSFSHPLHDRVRSLFHDMLWKVMQLDRSPLHEMPACSTYADVVQHCIDWH